MKKYLLGLAAIGVAIFMSSFDFRDKAKPVLPEPVLYWYDVNPAGQIISGTYIQDERADVVALGGPCVLLTGTVCKRGFENTVPSNQFSSPPAQVDDIRKN